MIAFIKTVSSSLDYDCWINIEESEGIRRLTHYIMGYGNCLIKIRVQAGVMFPNLC